jgi:hypothetical protein
MGSDDHYHRPKAGSEQVRESGRNALKPPLPMVFVLVRLVLVSSGLFRSRARSADDQQLSLFRS